MAQLVSELGWFKLSDKYYTRDVVYRDTFGQDVDLGKLDCFPAPFGGPVGFTSFLAFTTPVGGKIVRLEDNLRPTIDLYTCKGSKLATIQAAEYHSQIVTIGWNDIEHLVILLENGVVMLYGLDGTLLRKFNLEGDCKKPGVLAGKVWGGGLAVLTKNLLLYALLDFDSPFSIKLKNPGLLKPPVSWTIIEPQLSAEHRLEVLLATDNGSIVVATEDQVIDMRFTHGPFHHMAVAPSGKLLAAYTESGDVWICTVDFATELSRFMTRAPKPPKSLVWCGGDAVACVWDQGADKDRLVLLIGPSASYTHFHVDSAVVLVQEIDGVRLLKQNGVEFLHRVPSASVTVLKPGAQNPAASLLRASINFHEKQDPNSDKELRSIKAELPKAIDMVIEAAASESVSVERQQKLLTAAAYGQCFLENISSSKYIETAKLARVLHILHENDLPLTLLQYQLLGVEIVVERLLSRDLHWLASKICSYLNVSNHKVLIHWATRKVQQSDSDDVQVAEAIVSKLKSAPGVSFAAIAKQALRYERLELATLLLDFEPKASEQVPLLIQMQKFDRALKKAVESGDADLIHLVLILLQKSQPDQFLPLLRQQEEARRIWENVCKDSDIEELVRLYRSEGGPVYMPKLALLEVKGAFASKDLDQRGERLKRVVNMYKKFDDFAAKQTEEELQLLLIQRDLEISLGGKFVGSSLASTLYRCLLLGAQKRAKQLRLDFKVPNKRWWYIKIRALVDTERWDLLRSFSNQESPVGMEPFVEQCMRHNNLVEARFFLDKCPPTSKKAMLCIQMGRLDEAIRVAAQIKDPNKAIDALNRVKLKTTDPKLLHEINEMIHKVETEGYAEVPSLFEIASDARQYLQTVNTESFRTSLKESVATSLQSWWESDDNEVSAMDRVVGGAEDE